MVVGPKNFLTNPTRKGHYAQPGVLLGHKTQEGAELFTHLGHMPANRHTRRHDVVLLFCGRVGVALALVRPVRVDTYIITTGQLGWISPRQA